MISTLTRSFLATTLAACGLTLTAGAAGHAPTRVADTNLTLRAVGSIAYDKQSLQARAGRVKIVMKNASPLKHDVAIRGNGVKAKGKVVTTGRTSTAVARLKAGRYVFYCSVPGHEAAGMKGTLTVR